MSYATIAIVSCAIIFALVVVVSILSAFALQAKQDDLDERTRGIRRS